jgi:hypothetical protein
MEPSRANRRYLIAETPLSARDYDVPVGWWGWNWDPPVPMSITEIVRAGNMDARTAALCGMAIEAHGSLLISAEHPHSGKTTTLTALLDYLPVHARRIFVRGWSETFDFLEQTRPAETLLLVNELSSHLPVYLWGPKAVRLFSELGRGYALASTMHADSAEEAVTQLTDDLGVAPEDLGRVDLLMVMRLYYDPGTTRTGAAEGYATSSNGHARRVVSLHQLSGDGRTVMLAPLVTHDAKRDTHHHVVESQRSLLARLRHEDPAAAETELARRTAVLEGLIRKGTFAIPQVRSALAAERGERIPSLLRGDPVQ